jgi:RNA polymerase sigma-70 factor (ECF subfamily)
VAVIDSASAGRSLDRDADGPRSVGSLPEEDASPLPRKRGAADRDRRIETMVQLHFDVVWRSLRRLGVAESALDDAAQQVFLVAARRLDTIDRGGEKPYLLGIAVRVASDARRTSSRRREVSDERADERVDPRPSPEDLVDRKRARELLDEVLGAMPMDLRAAFTMFEIEGMSVPEVASALGIPLGTAASRLRRARDQFRELVHRHVRPEGGQSA